MEELQTETENNLGLTSPVEETVSAEPVETNDQPQTEELDAAPKNESARETVARVLKHQKEKNAPDGNKSQSETPEGLSTTDEKQPETAVVDEPQDDVDPDDYVPPNRLSAKEKALFNKLPKQMRPAIARMFKEHQAQFHRGHTELSKQIQETRHITEAVRPYYVSHPELASGGITEAALISGLIGAHMELTNPKTDKAKIQAIARDRGYSIRFEGDDEDSSTNTQADITNHPQFRSLQEQTNQLLSYVQNQQVSQIADPITKGWTAIRDERASDGQFRYPKMQDADFWTSAKPLISALTDSGMSHDDALKRAYIALHGQPHGQTTAPGLPAANNTNTRALEALTSVRGRSAPTSNGFNMPIENIPNSARDTVRMVLEQQRRGRVN